MGRKRGLHHAEVEWRQRCVDDAVKSLCPVGHGGYVGGIDSFRLDRNCWRDRVDPRGGEFEPSLIEIRQANLFRGRFSGEEASEAASFSTGTDDPDLHCETRSNVMV